ncbi:phage antirepressor [Latilactobacillus sakei]|uniref:Phage antirepressor n=1 Tax=Latilactobacillus sakei TaxID=1599 RepID=A0AAX0V9H3_LATSK|nr:phage antirepressor [Latilactobacillus sakei]PKX71426.1 phage antirepressor [Latilactobacillus sakei]PKX77256.1 phage antirepressor [Latilactobacillus sakei]USG05843.1 phage antirepressor [Latilactobacillus sakei]WAX23784.1 antirepressor protein [Latilactobacillus phage TMW 1.1386 P1]
MKDLQLFNFNSNQVRTVLIDNEPYFVGKDVAKILGYANTRDALSKHVDTEDKNSVVIRDGNKGNPNQVVINESGLYSLIISSKLPAAKEFKRWVTKEVLPSIRKNGAYLTAEKAEEILLNPDTIINLAQQVKNERQGRLIAEQRVNELTPKATYYDTVLANEALVSITVIAKDYGMSGAKMNMLLHDLKVQYKQGKTWLLYAKYQRNGWTQSETRMVQRKDGTEKAVLNTKWTQKGRLGLYELLKLNGVLPTIEQQQTA